MVFQVYDSNPFLYMPIDFQGGILDPMISIVFMQEGLLYDPLAGLYMVPNWEDTLSRIDSPSKLNQYRFNGNDPINSRPLHLPILESRTWLNLAGYKVKSILPHWNEYLWSIPWKQKTINSRKYLRHNLFTI